MLNGLNLLHYIKPHRTPKHLTLQSFINSPTHSYTDNIKIIVKISRYGILFSSQYLTCIRQQIEQFLFEKPGEKVFFKALDISWYPEI